MEKRFRITSSLETLEFDDELTCEVELFREGSWRHDSAPTGWFDIDKDRIHNLISNFNAGICGREIPLEFNHLPDSRTTPGWITSLYEKETDGVCSLWATLKLTDKEVAQRIRDGSLKYISPTVVSDYMDTATGQKFEVIRSATLTNYPHIKRLEPISVNFEEIRYKEEKMTEKEILEKNALELEDLEAITLEDLKEGGIDLEHLTDAQIKGLAEKFEMTVEQFQEQYPAAGKRMYGNRPRIKLPANVSADRKAEFFEVFNQMWDKHKDMEKAMKATMKRMGVAMEEEETSNSAIKEFAESVTAYVKKALGIKETKRSRDVDLSEDVTFEDLKTKVTELEDYKHKKELEEDQSLIAKYSSMTPAVQKIVTTMLSVGRSTALKFEDKSISLHDLMVLLLEELEKSPGIDMFTKKSITGLDQIVDLAEDLNQSAIKYQEDHPTLTYRQALDAVWVQRNNKK